MKALFIPPMSSKRLNEIAAAVQKFIDNDKLYQYYDDELPSQIRYLNQLVVEVQFQRREIAYLKSIMRGSPMSKKCEFCGRFMALTDEYSSFDDDFDEELAIEHGFDPETDSQVDDKWLGYHYVQDQWGCDNCDVAETHVEGKRYYFNPEAINYTADAPSSERSAP